VRERFQGMDLAARIGLTTDEVAVTHLALTGLLGT
jgi:hypothetical protein